MITHQLTWGTATAIFDLALRAIENNVEVTNRELLAMHSIYEQCDEEGKQLLKLKYADKIPFLDFSKLKF